MRRSFADMSLVGVVAQPCIQPNPDIAGIGVRVSIYAQGFLILIPTLLFVSDGEISDKELKSIRKLSANLLLTACALLVSTYIQAAASGIDLYHAVIVLNLSWINNMSTMAGLTNFA